MKKYHVFLFSLFFCPIAALAQYQNATAEQKKEIVNKITQNSVNVNTMLCGFTQVKELSFLDEKVTSEGKMFYKKTNKIRWEYTVPVQYAFSTDGKTMSGTAGGKTTTVPANQRKFFDGICRVMISGITGTGLVDSSDFDTDFFVGSADYMVVLNPKKKEVTDLYSSILLYVSKTNNRVYSIELVEKTGDKTTITLNNIQVNATINDAIFSQ